jgi:hypothetical protein
MTTVLLPSLFVMIVNGHGAQMLCTHPPPIELRYYLLLKDIIKFSSNMTLSLPSLPNLAVEVLILTAILFSLWVVLALIAKFILLPFEFYATVLVISFIAISTALYASRGLVLSILLILVYFQSLGIGDDRS